MPEHTLWRFKRQRLVISVEGHEVTVEVRLLTGNAAFLVVSHDPTVSVQAEEAFLRPGFTQPVPEGVEECS